MLNSLCFTAVSIDINLGSCWSNAEIQIINPAVIDSIIQVVIFKKLFLFRRKLLWKTEPERKRVCLHPVETDLNRDWNRDGRCL